MIDSFDFLGSDPSGDRVLPTLMAAKRHLARSPWQVYHDSNTMDKCKTVLFLCTGNYYRSRFAEILFNSLACRMKLDWAADSRALRITAGRNVGPIAQAAIGGLRQRGIDLPSMIRFPLQACEGDFASATLIIALKEAEHRPLLESQYPRWAHRVEYWHVHDMDQATAAEALAEIERGVQELIARLKGEAAVA